MSDMDALWVFVKESNWIEGIHRAPTPEEIAAHEQFLANTDPSTTTFELFVERIQPGAILRNRPGLNVRAGKHIPPPGGPKVVDALWSLIYQARAHSESESIAYMIHRDYETLHPFTDGNGRSGRVWWLKLMGGPEKVPLGFLHTWYYQSLQFGRT
jgi:hypothetical protein